MKTLLLVRHAKSSWNNSSITDFERPLNERGKNDAPAMAKIFRSKKINIDAFISSPAKRAKKTAEIFMEEFKVDNKNLILAPTLYEATLDSFYDVVENLKDKIDSAALFAHNPGITDFINSFECHPVYEMPTCGLFALNIATKTWQDIRESKKEFLFFDFPKNQ